MTEAAKTYNHDVAGLWRRINRFIQELAKSQSSPGNEVKSYDVGRLQSYLDALTAYIGWVTDQPELDLPETHPREIVLEAPGEYNMPENESLVDVIAMLEMARDETAHGQSSRNASGLNKFDTGRLNAVVEKVQSFLDNYINEATPLDLPESTPMRAMPNPGKRGV